MSKFNSHEALNRLLALQYRSLSRYVVQACPWTHRGDEKAIAALRHIVEDQEAMANRIAQYIIEHYGDVDTGEYPMAFTSIHDLSLDYLLRRLAEHQKQDIVAIEQCVAELTSDPVGRSLAEEALGAARAHLESLEEVTRQAV